MPEPEIMDAELGVTLQDWAHIPVHELPEICAEARRQSHGFPPPNSLVVEIWSEEQARRRRHRLDSELYRLTSEPAPEVTRTPEEKAAIEKFFEELKKSI